MFDYSESGREKIIHKRYDTELLRKSINAAVLLLKRFIIAAILIAMCSTAGLAFGVLYGIIARAPKSDSIEITPMEYTSIMYDVKGEEIKRLFDAENREFVYIDDIADNLCDAFVAIEDERFYTHSGIDLRSIGRAIKNNFNNRALSEGASTITQQVMKNNVVGDSKSFKRKIQEQYLALMYERKLTNELGSKEKAKDKILEAYLNTVGLGNGLNGVETASRRYFDKSVEDLSLSECAVIAAITQNPSRYDPIRHPDNNRERRNLVLYKMEELGYITNEEKIKAENEDVYGKIITSDEIYKGGITSNTYFVDQLFSDVIRDLQERNGMTREEANELMYSGGLRVYSTWDREVQKKLDYHVNNADNYPKEIYRLLVDYSVYIEGPEGEKESISRRFSVANEDKIEAEITKIKEEVVPPEYSVLAEKTVHIAQPQVGVAIVDNGTGRVVALSGGRGEKIGDRTFNRATQAKRQPGSVFKIVASIAPAVDMDLINPDSRIQDSPLTIGDYSPKNWYSGYRGAVTTRDMVRDSLNVATVRNMVDSGIDNCMDYLINKFGFTTIVDEDWNAATCLGGLTYGVTQLELAAAYATIANGGIYYEPITYTRVEDYKGNIILENNYRGKGGERVLQSKSAMYLLDMMRDVLLSGTGKEALFKEIPIPVVGKTGTTTDTKDLVFTGSTPSLTASLWFGNDDGEAMNRLYNQQYHIKLWRLIMEDISQSDVGIPFPYSAEANKSYIKHLEMFGDFIVEVEEEEPEQSE